MGATARRIEIEIIGDAKNFQNALGKASGSADSFGSSLGRMAKYGALAVGAAGIGGLAVVLRSGIKEFAEASKVSAQTGAVLKSTGGAANVTAGQVSNLAEALMRKSGVDDEAIQSGENMLLTFTKVRNELGKGNDIFDQATKAALNFSVATGKDMVAASLLVGKALNDPIKGLTALSRSGVQFTAAQKEMISSMVAAGDTMGAQKVILGELTTQFGGSAEALGKTLPGQINILKESFSNLAGGMVGALVPAFTGVMNATSDFIQRMGEADGAGAKFGVAMDALKSIAVKAWDGIKGAFNSIDWAAVGQSLGEGLRRALAFLSAIDYGGILRTVAAAVLNAIKSAFNAIDWGAVGNAVGTALVKALNGIAKFVNSVDWNNVGQQLVHGIGVTIKALATFLAGVNWATVLGALTMGIIAVLKGLAGLLVGIASALGKAIITGIGQGLANLGGWLTDKLQAIPQALTGLIGMASSLAVTIGLAIVSGILSGVAGLFGALKDAVGSAIGSALGSINIPGRSPPEHAAAEMVGKPLAAGVINGFLLGIGPLPSKISESLSRALEAGKAVIERYQAVLGDAFGKLGDFVKRAFDAKTANLLDNVTKKFDAQIAKWQGYADALTPAEKALAAMDKAEGESARAAALAAAEKAQIAANQMAAGAERDAAQLAAEQMKQAALTAIARAGLEAQAGVERAAREAEAASHIAAIEATKARELANLEERRNQMAAKLDEQLVVLQERLAKHPEEYDKIQKKIEALLKSYGIPMKTLGKALGEALAEGLRNSIPTAVAAARALGKAVATELAKWVPHSPAEKGPLSKPIDWAGYLTAGMPKGAALAGMGSRLAGGMVAGPSMAMAGVGGGSRGGYSGPERIILQLDGRTIAEVTRKEWQRQAGRNG